MSRNHHASPPATQPLHHAAAAACFVATGFFALVYEVCWIREASLVFGSTTYAFSTVLAVFFGGMAVGSYLFGRRSRGLARPVRLYGILEIGLGAFALVSPWLFRAADVLFGSIYPLVYESFWLLSAARLGMVVTLLLLPSALMGGSLPLLCRQYVQSEARSSRMVGLLYGINTLGAALGCAVCGLVFLPRFGLTSTLVGCGLANIAVGLLAARLPVVVRTDDKGFAERQGVSAPLFDKTESSSRKAALVGGLFFLTGFVAIADEVLWSRYLLLLMRDTVYTYTLTLATVLLGIVLGSMLAGGWFDRIRRRTLVFGALHAAIALSVLAVLLTPAAWWNAWLDPERIGRQLAIIAAVLLLPAALSGAAFPLAIRLVLQQPESAGLVVGRMAALNTLGGICGSLVCGFWLLPEIGMQATLMIVTGLSVAIGVTAWLALESSAAMGVRLALSAAAVAAWAALPLALPTRLPEDFLARQRPLVEFREGVGSFAAVLRRGEHLELEINRSWQGSTEKSHQIMAAHLPMLLHPEAEHVLVVGLGPGQAASRFLRYDVARLDCVEIEAELEPLVRKYFEGRWLDDPRVRLLIEDGRNYLNHTEQRYDLISIEVGQVFRPGVASFYTTEFYAQLRKRLHPGGVVSQFVPISFFSPDEFRSVIGTFVARFPHAALFYNRTEFLLIGGEGLLQFSPDQLQRLLTASRIREDLAFAHWGGPPHRMHEMQALLASYLCGGDALAALSKGSRTLSDDLPWLEYQIEHSGENAEGKIVELLRGHLSGIDSILPAGHPVSENALAAAAEMRLKNLGNVVARVLAREAAPHRLAGNHREAARLLREALRRNPDNVRINLMLAGELTQLGRSEEAYRFLEHAVRIDPESPDAHNSLGLWFAARDEYAAAERNYRAALAADRSFALAHHNLALVLREQGDAQEALRHFRAAIEHKPDFPQGHYELARLLAEFGRYEGAETHLEKVLAIDPDFREAELFLREVRIRRRQSVGGG